MRKILLLGIVFLLVIGLVAGCGGGDNAAQNENKQNEQSEQNDSEKQTYVVGCDTSFVPFEYLDEESGKYVGYDIDLWAEIAKRIGIEYELKPMDFAGLIPALQSDKIDVAIAAMTITDERKEVVDFSIPYYDAGLLILVAEDETEIKGVDDLTGKVVATKMGTTSYNFVQSLEGIKEIKPFPNIAEAYMELEKGGADAVVFDSPNVLYYIKTKGEGKVKTVGDLLQGQQYGIAFPKGSELKAKVDGALQEMMDDGTYDKIYEKWFGQKPPKK